MRGDLSPADEELSIKPGRLPGSAGHDGRWPLWRALDRRRAELVGGRADWAAASFAHYREAHTITFAFDSRLPAKAVRATLNDQLPRLRARGWMSATRPLGPFELALVRYVCLESPLAASWRQRTRGWRRSHFVAAHPKWGKRYRGKKAARRFKRDFHGAETALAGSKGALALHYKPGVRERRLELRRNQAEVGPASTVQGLSPSPESIVWRRGDAARAEALRARFAAGAEIEALVARAQAGDAAAADEAIALCLRWRPDAIDELSARLGRVPGGDPGDAT